MLLIITPARSYHCDVLSTLTLAIHGHQEPLHFVMATTKNLLQRQSTLGSVLHCGPGRCKTRILSLNPIGCLAKNIIQRSYTGCCRKGTFLNIYQLILAHLPLLCGVENVNTLPSLAMSQTQNWRFNCFL